jgi:hypothetical protein
MSNLSGHNFRHSTENANLPKAAESPVNVDSEGVEWRALGDGFRTLAFLSPQPSVLRATNLWRALG